MPMPLAEAPPSMPTGHGLDVAAMPLETAPVAGWCAPRAASAMPDWISGLVAAGFDECHGAFVGCIDNQIESRLKDFLHPSKEKKIDHEGGFQGALLLQSTTRTIKARKRPCLQVLHTRMKYDNFCRTTSEDSLVHSLVVLGKRTIIFNRD